jgi:hypothetical protein
MEKELLALQNQQVGETVRRGLAGQNEKGNAYYGGFNYHFCHFSAGFIILQNFIIFILFY